jgi:hypothetical protein
MVELFKSLSPILVAVIAILIPYQQLKNEKLKSINKKLSEEIQDLSMSIQLDLQTFNDIREVVENILYKTKADRFLILSATNGIRDMRFATAIYEQHKNNDKISLSIGATGKYIKFEFDSHYKEMLKNVEYQQSLNFETAKMKESDLKSIYETEGINFTNVYFLKRAKIDNDNDRLFYCSVATHNAEPFSSSENSILKISVDRLKSKFESL